MEARRTLAITVLISGATAGCRSAIPQAGAEAATVGLTQLLLLGSDSAKAAPGRTRDSVVAALLRLYERDPDPAVHATVRWLLRYDKAGDKPRAVNWSHPAAIARLDSALAGKPAAGKRWYVTRELQTMVIVPEPVEFIMGSPLNEVGRSEDEVQHRVRIPRSFAIASTEVTVAEFRRFLDANPWVNRQHRFADDSARMADVMRRFSPAADGPQIAVTWYEAAMYCNWLSARDGLPPSEWVYPAAPESVTNGMSLPNNYLSRTGYRLPTEAEWEYAARSGTRTARFFGNNAALLREYSWHRSRAPRSKDDPLPPGDPPRTYPVGQLKPNAFGLFDMYGNVWEWVQDRRASYPTNAGVHVDTEDSIVVVSDSVARVRRGGAFSYEPAMHRSAHRGTTNTFPTQRRDNVGFRVARTIRP